MRFYSLFLPKKKKSKSKTGDTSAYRVMKVPSIKENMNWHEKREKKDVFLP